MHRKHYKKVAKKKKTKSHKAISRRTAAKKRSVKVEKRKSSTRARRKHKKNQPEVFTDPAPALTATQVEQQAGQAAVEDAAPTPVPPDVAAQTDLSGVQPVLQTPGDPKPDEAA
jgi:hypothetical protein